MISVLTESKDGQTFTIASVIRPTLTISITLPCTLMQGEQNGCLMRQKNQSQTIFVICD